MFAFLRKSLSYIVTGSCSIVFAACYGPPARLENPKVLNVKNGDSEAIAGLKVSLFENNAMVDEKFTNVSGNVEFYFAQKNDLTYKATIEDVDGSLNGEYKAQIVDITQNSVSDITMENKE